MDLENATSPLVAPTVSASTFYNPAFFQGQMAGSVKSARVMLKLLFAEISVNSLVDVGCGVGPWAAASRELGVSETVGIDGAYVDTTRLMIPADSFRAIDLNAVDQHTKLERFDLAVCVEVAEHLSPDRAASFIAFLTGLSNFVLFGAAIPDQGGTNHINEQWQTYWAELFFALGYHPFDILRSKVWMNPDVEYWYKQNTILYVHANELMPDMKPSDLGSLNLVHPDLYIAKSRLLKDAFDQVNSFKLNAAKL